MVSRVDEHLRQLEQIEALEIAKQEGGNKGEDMSGYGSNWPPTMQEQGLPTNPSDLPGEIEEPKQLELDLFPKAGLQDGDLIARGLVDRIREFGDKLVGPLPGQDKLEDLLEGSPSPGILSPTPPGNKHREKSDKSNPFEGFPEGFNPLDPSTHGNLNSEQLDKLIDYLKNLNKRMEGMQKEKGIQEERELLDVEPDPANPEYGKPQTWA